MVPVPPFSVTLALPVAAPKQTALTWLVFNARLPELVIVVVAVAVQLCASVTVSVYVAGAKFEAVANVELLLQL